MRTVTIKILDEINIVVIGLTVEESKIFYDKFGFYDSNYAFKPQYKLGRWDGKVRLYSKSGKTSIHFLPELLPELRKMGHKIALIDNRNPVTFDLDPIEATHFNATYGIILGEHQVECVNALIENRGGIAIAATGAGKSYVIGALFNILHERMGMKCLAVVPTTDLVLQTAAEIKLFGNSVGMFYGKEKDLKKTHLVSTWQSLQNSPQVMAMYDAIVIDEAHGAKSSVLKNMLMDHGNRAIFIAGVTGTLPKPEADIRQVNYVLGYPVSEVGGKELIDLGWLAKLKLKTIKLEENFRSMWEKWKADSPDATKLTYRSFKSNYFPDYPSERNWLKANKSRNAFLADFIANATAHIGNSFVLVNGVDFGKRLAKIIPNAIFVHGADDNAVRKQIYDLFTENNGVIVIATYQLASTGLNIKRIFNLFMVDPGKSFIQIIQSIGRGLRKAVDKDTVVVWDISSDLKYSNRHSSLRKKYYIEQHYRFKEEEIDYMSFFNDSTENIDNNEDIVVY